MEGTKASEVEESLEVVQLQPMGLGLCVELVYETEHRVEVSSHAALGIYARRLTDRKAMGYISG